MITGFNASCFTHEALKQVFTKMNTTVSSCAAIEKVCSIGKGILQPKRLGLGDIHFEMLFLKADK